MQDGKFLCSTENWTPPAQVVLGELVQNWLVSRVDGRLDRIPVSCDVAKGIGGGACVQVVDFVDRHIQARGGMMGRGDGDKKSGDLSTALVSEPDGQEEAELGRE
jgi:hypothetical protein